MMNNPQPMTKDELIAKLTKLEEENKDLRARVDVLERRLHWERHYDQQLKPIPMPSQPTYEYKPYWQNPIMCNL